MSYKVVCHVMSAAFVSRICRKSSWKKREVREMIG